MSLELSERKKKILRAIVDSYVRTAEPVGSKAIAAMPGMDFSTLMMIFMLLKKKI